jgi:hypothetical protein
MITIAIKINKVKKMMKMKTAVKRMRMIIIILKKRNKTAMTKRIENHHLHHII